jgi:hypothetical protein
MLEDNVSEPEAKPPDSIDSTNAFPAPPHGFEEKGKGRLWCCIVQSGNRSFIGKATSQEAWYGVGGKELYTKNFKIWNTSLVPSDEPSSSCIMTQDGYGELWFALATTDHGAIPGKASKAQDGVAAKCWYTFANTEHCIDRNFQYLLIADSIVE